MADTDSSALISFIASQQEPIRKSGAPRDTVSPPVLLPIRQSHLRLRLLLTGLLLLIGFLGGLIASQSRAGRWVLAHAGWSAPEPLEPVAAAPEAPPAAPTPAAAPAPASAPAPSPPPAPVAAPPPPAPVAAPAEVPTPPKKEKKKAHEGTLAVSAKPVCDILIDGKDTGLRTPQKSLHLKVGRHRLALVNRDLGIKKKLKVRIKEGKTTKVSQDLRD